MALGSALAALGCAATPARAPLDENAPRRPDGVAIDPPSRPPAAQDRASTDDALVTLRAPLGDEAARATIERFFGIVADEDPEAMGGILTKDAVLTMPSSGSYYGQQAPQAMSYWLERFRRLDYTKVDAAAVFRRPEVEIVHGGDAPGVVSHPAIRVEALEANDVVLRVPIATPQPAGGDRIFGEEIVFWLRREEGGYRIYRLLEEFQLN